MMTTNRIINLDDFDPDANLIDHMVPVANQGSAYYTVEDFNDSVSSNDLVIISYFIRSFNKNFDNFEAMLYSLSNCPKILVLSETWLQDEVILDGYNSFHTFRTDRRSGGVSVFCSVEFGAVKIEECCVSSDFIESCAIKVNINNIEHNFFIIIALYRPHQGIITEFNAALDDILSKFSPD